MGVVILEVSAFGWFIALLTESQPELKRNSWHHSIIFS